MSIQPSLRAHGGRVNPVDIQNGSLLVEFLGGCQGCSQVSITVKEGIEKIMKKEVPEIKEVRDVTNHDRGKNPYFK